MLSKGVLLLVVFTAGAIAVADDYFYDLQNDEAGRTTTQCATSCPVSASSSKFGYETGKTYEYVYESDIKTTVPGRMAEHSSLHMRASVQIEVISTCEMVLRLSEVSLQDSNPTNIESRQHVENAVAFKRGLQSKTMAFSFVDGQIDSICPEADDETWAVNIKRGILSAFQNTMTTLQSGSNARETDVSGNCPVRYEPLSGGWGTRKVKKTKNLLACTDRQSGQTIFQAVQYDTASDIQSMPLMKSSHSCEQEISNRDRIISKTSCSEVHVFRPFAREDSGATTEVTYKLEFQRKTDAVSTQQAISRTRSTLLYDHRLSDEEMAENVRDARASLTNLCRQTEVDVRPDAPGLFNGLVKQMRKLDASNLKRLLATTKTGMCQKAEQYFRDALPVLGTTGGVVVMRDLMSEGKANNMETERWLTSIAFISNPTPDMMKELQPLLTSDFERSALPVSSLINTYCQQYDDKESVEVQQMLKTMEDELKYNCKYETEAERSRMLKALKAIGNAGNAERVVPTLNRCITNNEVPIALRVAAISAFRRISCSVERTDLISLMENKQADAELRIMAYLAVMQCANGDIIGRVRTMLESDEVNQVGSFIWTHLTNLQETSCPMKSDIQDLLKDVLLSKTYDLDKRKFSRNIELSGFSEVFNMGAVLESNLIWSAQSYVPRSTMVNLTVDVFGQSINFVEFGGRAQGLEALLERFFGPGSDNSIRQKRAVIKDEVLNVIDRKYPKMRDDLSLSYYMRIFGNEIRSGEINDFDLDGAKNRFNFLDWLIKLAQDNRIDVTRNFLFLDSTFTVPTGVGMPLRLGVEGTATIAFTASGKVDILRMTSSPSNFDINGSIRPSAAIEIRGEMGVCAHFARTGLKTVNLLHTSRILDGKIQLQDGKIFNVDLNLPQEKVEIFNAESHFYVTYRGQDREQQGLRPGGFEKKECTGPKVSYIFGVELCGEVSLKGPFVAKAYVNKKDTHTGYHFEAGYRKSVDEMTDSIRVSLNTPGSRIDREITADFKLDRANSQLEMNLKSPWKKVSAQGSLVKSAALKRAIVRAVIDDTLEYSVNAEFQIDDKRTEVRYIPNIRVTYPDPRTQQQAEVVFDGSVVHTRGKKVAINVALRNAFQQPITLDGSVELQDKKNARKYELKNIQFSSPFVKAGLAGFISNIQEAGNTWSSRAELSYQVTGERTKEKIIINHKFRDLSTSNLRSYSTDFSWTSTMRPRYNGQVGLELAFSPNSLRTKVEAGIDNMKKITIVQSGAFDFSGNDKKINGMLKFELPYKNWNYELKVDHINNWETLQSNATIKYDENKQLSLDIGLKKQNTKFLNIQGEAIFRMPEVEMSISHSLTEKAPREYYGELSVQGIPRLQRARITSTYKTMPRHEFSADVTVNGWEPISIKTHLNPNLKNLESHAEFTYGTRNYMADVNWLHRGTGMAFNTRANAEVAYLGKSHGITAEASRRNQEFSTSIEVKVAENKKFSLSSQVTAIPTEPKVQARLEWPDNFMALSAKGKYETKGWYTTTNDLEGSIEFTSSLPRLEKLGASFRHDQSAKSMKSNGEMSWATDKKITGDFSYDKNKISLDLTTPFVGYQVIKAEAAYTPKGKQYGHTTKLSWDTNQMVLAITGEFNSPSLNGRVTFTSPFKGFESLSTSLRHAVAGDNYQTNADVTWARGQQITVAMNMNHNRNGWAMTNSGDLKVQTPFGGYRVTKLTWSHQNDRSTWKCHKELELSGQKYILDIDSGHMLTRVARQLTATASFQSPIQGYENLRFSAEYQHDLRGIKNVGKSSVSWGSNSIEYEHDVTYVPNAALLIKGQLATPFRNIGTVGIDMNNRRSGNTFTAANELNIGRYGKSTLGGTLSFDGYNIDANLRLTTPYKYLERIATTLKNSKQQDIWVSHADFEYAPDKSYSVDTKVGWESQKKVEMEVNTPHDSMRSMKFKSGVTGTVRNFQVSSELEHSTFQEKMTFVLSADTTNTRNLNAMVDIRTPFSAFSNLKATASHTRRNPQSCLTTGSYEFNNLRGSLNQEVTARSWVDFNTKTELEYITGRKMELTTSFSIDPKIVGTATFKSPFPRAREIGLTFSHEGPLDNFKSAMELSYNRRDKINSNLEFMFREGTLRVFSRLTTPYQTVERAAMEINHSGSLNNFRSDASFELNSQKMAGNVEFQNDQSGIKVSGQLETPFQYLRQGTASLNHNGGWRSFSNNAEISYDGYTISTTSEFSLDGPVAKFTLSTPYRPVQNVNFNFVHELKSGRSGKGWGNSASFQFNDQRYTGESEWIWVGKQLRAKAMVMIPQEYSIVLQHRADSIRDFSNSVTLKMDEQTVTGSSNFKYTTNLIDAKATVDTTYQGYNKFEATFKHEGPVSDFTTRASISTPFRNYKSFSSELTYRGNPNDFTSSLTVNTPFRAMTRMSATVNHRFTGQTLNSGVTVTNAAEQQIIASVSFQKDGSSIEAGAKLKTPYSGYENFEANIRFSGDLRNFRSSASVTTPFDGYERFSAELNHAGPWSRFKTSGKLESTPVPSLSFSIEHSATNAWNINTAVEVDIPAGKIATSFSNNGEPENFRSGLRVSTPFRGYNKFEVNLEHEGGLDTPKSKVTVQTPFRGYNSFQLSSEKSGNLKNIQLKAELTTSIRNWEKTAASWTHNVDGVNSVQMSGQIETSYPGLEKVTGSLNHNQNAEGFDMTISVETPVQGYERQSLTINHSRRRSIKTTVTVETSIPGYSRFSGNFEFTNFRSTGNLGNFHYSVCVTNPFKGYERFSAEISYEHELQSARSGKSRVNSASLKVNDQRYIGASEEISRIKQLKTKVVVMIPQEYSIDILHRHYSIKDFGNSVTLKMDNVGFDFGFKNMLTSDLTDRSIRFKMALPRRSIGIDLGYNLSTAKFANHGELQWNSDPYMYEIVGTNSSTGDGTDYYGTLNVTSRLHTSTSTFRHKTNAWGKYSTEIVILTTERLCMSNEVVMTSSGFTHALLVQHPRFSQGVSITSNGTLTRNSKGDKITITDKRQSFNSILEFMLKGGTLQVCSRLITPIHFEERAFIEINHSGSLNEFRTHASFELKSQKMAGNIKFQNNQSGIKFSGKLEIPFRYLPLSTASLNHNRPVHYVNFNFTHELRNGSSGMGWDNSASLQFNNRNYTGESEWIWVGKQLRAKAVVKIPKEYSIVLQHRADSIRDFSNSVTLKKDKQIMTGSSNFKYTKNLGGRLPDFTTSAAVEYNNKKLETELTFKRTASIYDFSYETAFKINSPYAYVRDFNLVALHNYHTEIKTGALDVTLNAEKKVNFDYRYTTSGDQQITINIRNPYTMSTQLNMAGSDGQAVVNWDTTRQDSQVRFDFGFKNMQTSDLTDRSIRFKTALPRRTIGFELGYSLSADKFTNRGEMQWDSDPESEFVYEIEGTRSSTRYVTAYDGILNVTSGLHTSTSTFSHKTNPRRKYSTEVVIQATERLRMSNEVVMTSSGFTHTFLVQHPRFTQDVSITSEGTLTGNSKGVKTTIKYERQSFNLEGQVTDESQYGSLRSSGTFRFSHPNSFTDVQVSGDVFNDYEKVGGNAEIKYQMTRERSMQTASLRTQVTKASSDFSLELTTPVDTLRLTATNRFADNSNGMYGYELAAQTSQINVKAVSELSLRDRSFDAKFYYTTADYLHLFAQALSPIQATFEMSRYINGERTNDISASLSLSDDRLLSGSAFIRPGLFEDVRQLLRPDQLYPRELAAKTQQWTRTMSDDFNLKSLRMQQASVPFTNAAKAIANDVKAKVEEAKDAVQVMYDRNEFYIRDMHIAAGQINEAVQNKLNEMRRSLEVFSYRAQRYLSYYNRLWQQRMDEVSRRLAESWQTVANRWEEMRPYWDNATSTLQAKIDELGNCIRNHPRIRALIDRLNALELSDFLPPSDWQERLQAAYANYRRQVEEFMSRPELREVREWLIKRVEETMWMYEYLGYRDQVTLWIEQVRDLTWETIKTKAVDSVKNFLQLNKNRWTSWDVTRGEYAFQIYVLFDAMDLSFLQRLNLQKYLDYARSAIARKIPDEEWSLIDTVYSYWPSKDIYNWIPPFKSHASITGSQHFMTFDHKFYEFAGECSYLLTRDFVDKSFSVVVNYDKMVNNLPTRKSITVISDGKQIEVFPDAKVTVDGVRSEMPLRVANTTIKRTGNAISIDSDRGFSVFCNLPHDHCSISVSGWYYNKIAGLLGTYDNEPSNDMTTIDNTVTDRPETFAYSWTVGQKCRPNNRAIEQRAEPDTKRYQVCAKYFQNSASPFRSCFRQVNPEPYIQMCVNDLPSTDEEIISDEGVCKVAAAYVHECRRHEVHLRLPRTCVRCEVPDSGRTYNESSTFKFSSEVPAPKIADVVFIVQHSPCNKDLMDKVKGLMDDLDKAMTIEGLSNTRYAIVGFGGKDHLVTPHIHTMDGQIFNTANKISQGLNKFDLEAGQLRDPMAAIRYAAKLAFRAGASKNFILLACDTCTENSIRYRNLQTALLEGDVRLHVLVQGLIGLKTQAQSVKTAFIFGVDLYTVYTRKDVADEVLNGEPDLVKYIHVPKDLCVALTQDTDGSYFSARQWLDSRPIIQKRFTDVMVRTFARKAQPSECQDCECVADELGVGFSQCSNCQARNPIHGDYPNFEKDDEEVPPTPASPIPTTTKTNAVRPGYDATPKLRATTTRRTRPVTRPRAILRTTRRP